jgi:hypothetical protein
LIKKLSNKIFLVKRKLGQTDLFRASPATIDSAYFSCPPITRRPLSIKKSPSVNGRKTNSILFYIGTEKRTAEKLTCLGRK